MKFLAKGSARENFPLIQTYRALDLRIKVVVLLAVFIILPWIVGSYWTQVLFIVGLYVLMGVGLNVAVGFAGLLVLGYAAFYGISAYTYGLLVRVLSPDPAQDYTNFFWLLIPVCVFVAGIVGFILGIFRLAVDTPVKLFDGFSYAQGSLLWIVNNTYFQYYSLLITVICIIVMIAVSYWSEEPAYNVIQGLTFSTMTDQDRLETRKSWDYRDVLASVMVLLIILAAYLFFTG